MSISTSNLLFFLSQTSDLLSFFQKYEDELIKETPGGCLYALLDKYGLRPGDISARTGTGNYVYRILNDERTPGRDTVVAFCLAIGSTLSECQTLLRISRHARTHSLRLKVHRNSSAPSSCCASTNSP